MITLSSTYLLSSRRMAAGGSGPLPVEHIFQLLDSAETVGDIRDIILENLSSSEDLIIISLELIILFFFSALIYEGLKCTII